jgi:predicted dithiol-disulfide oxidoreductase (DUF899 family)
MRISMTDELRSIEHHPVVSGEEWTSARKELLAREEEFTRVHHHDRYEV